MDPKDMCIEKRFADGDPLGTFSCSPSREGAWAECHALQKMFPVPTLPLQFSFTGISFNFGLD
jgi:hypothetical protein